LSIMAVGDITRFGAPERLVCYLGLNPRARQSGNQPATHGRITKAGPGYARGMLVEAAFSASKAPGPLRAFYQRVRARRGLQVAIVVTARKLTVLCWHLLVKGEEFAFAMPPLVAHKQRKLELRAGLPPARGRKSHCGALLAEAGARRRTRPRPAQRARLPDHGRQLASQPTGEQDTLATGIVQRWQWTWPPAPGHDSDAHTNQRRLPA
jgi:hypothetical protein